MKRAAPLLIAALLILIAGTAEHASAEGCQVEIHILYAGSLDPVVGAIVSITDGERTYTAVTNAAGIASFTIELQELPYTISIVEPVTATTYFSFEWLACGQPRTEILPPPPPPCPDPLSPSCSSE